MFNKLTVLFIVALAFGAPLSFAHGGKEHFMGTVIAVDSSHIEVKTTDGKTVSARITQDTQVLKGKVSGTLADIKVRSRVMVDVTGEERNYTAEKVQLPTEE